MKVTYSGYYGFQNSGDDAFCEIAAWGARRYWHATKHIFFARTLPRITTVASCYSPHSSYSNFLRAVKDIMDSDIFVSAGGSTFHSGLKATDLRLYAGAKRLIPTRGKIGAIGISLGPYKNAAAERSTLSYLKKLDFIALRDRMSYEIALSYNLAQVPVLAFDLAALLPEIYPITSYTDFKKSNAMPVIGISVCNYERYIGKDRAVEERRNRYILNVLRGLQKQFRPHFRFFIFNGNAIVGDQAVTGELISVLSTDHNFSYDVIPYLSNVGETYSKINECSLIFSTRLHASVFACFGSTPFLLVEYHRKCTDFLDDVGQVDRYRIYDGDMTETNLVGIIAEILDGGAFHRPRYLNEVRARAIRNFTCELSPT